MSGPRAVVVWAVLAGLVILPLSLAAFSPYLAYRNAAYVVAGFAGILALALLLVQPLLALRALPGVGAVQSRRWHLWCGRLIVLGVLAHLAGLYLTSAADTLDALLLVSPTPFSVYGVAAFWAVLATAALAGLRARVSLRRWRMLHNLLGLAIITGSIAHALLIEGTMQTTSKWVLCAAIAAIGIYAIAYRGLFGDLVKRRQRRFPP